MTFSIYPNREAVIQLQWRFRKTIWKRRGRKGWSDRLHLPKASLFPDIKDKAMNGETGTCWCSYSCWTSATYTFSVLPPVIKCWTPDDKARNPSQCRCWPLLVFHIAPYRCPVFNSEIAPVLPLLLKTEQKSLWHDMCPQLPAKQQQFIQHCFDLSRCSTVTVITTTKIV